MSRRIAYLGIKGLPPKAGADRAVAAIVQRLDRDKFDITVYCSSRVVPRGTRVPRTRLVRIPTLAGKHLHATSLFLFSAIHALCFGRYDLVHVHNVEACFVLPLLRLRYKVISTSHGTAYALTKWGKAARMLLRLTEYPFIALSSCVTSVSEALASEYECKYGRRVHHVPNGVDTDVQINATAEAPILKALGLGNKGYVLFAAARVIPEKGCHLLLDAWSRLAPDIELLVVGDTTQIPAYEQRLKGMAHGRVRFVPFISCRENLFDLIRCARLFVFPSIVEAMSMALLEAAALGAPLVCSDIVSNT
jgi:glycosyltransferase involved in cell wall biosynthesis